jgi:Nif-specific regulatory protein
MMESVWPEGDSLEVRRTALLEIELEVLFLVSQVLSRPFELRETLQQLLEVLHEHGGLLRGMVTLFDPDKNELLVSVVHGRDPQRSQPVRYRSGEGIVGRIQALGKTVVLRRITEEPRFLNRLGLYDLELPFIGVPIVAGENRLAGVLAAQPACRDELLPERARFLEMVANLIARSVQLSWELERERQDLTAERDSLRRTVRGRYGFDSIVGHSRAMQFVFDQVRQVAKWNTTALIRGESGTGKELIANAIHYNSPRAGGPLIKLNCAALTDNLLESELFGHEKGAFTGALRQRKGRFEQAHGGTLFLDEIGDVSPSFQVRLLRVLQEGEMERLGSSHTMQVDVRIIAATNRDLEAKVDVGEFREDLYYRLNVMPIFIPPLRQRPEDIPELAHFLVDKLAKRQARPLSITDSAIRLLLRHYWPGNVRELENCLERAAIMSPAGVIDQDVVEIMGAESLGSMAVSAPEKIDLDDAEMDERERVIAALEQTGWVQAKAARLLGMTPRQIAYRIQTFNIKVRRL